MATIVCGTCPKIALHTNKQYAEENTCNTDIQTYIDRLIRMYFNALRKQTTVAYFVCLLTVCVRCLPCVWVTSILKQCIRWTTHKSINVSIFQNFLNKPTIWFLRWYLQAPSGKGKMSSTRTRFRLRFHKETKTEKKSAERNILF